VHDCFLSFRPFGGGGLERPDPGYLTEDCLLPGRAVESFHSPNHGEITSFFAGEGLLLFDQVDIP